MISKDSPITVLLIREAHAKNLQGGPQLTLFYLRQTIWIPGGLSAVKNIIYNCKPCIRHDARILQPQMGDLPTERFHHFSPTERHHFLSPTLVWTTVDLSAQKTAAENCRRRNLPFLYVSAQRPFIWKQQQR